MKTGVVVINFGEPADPTMEAVVPFLERIFLLNAGLERLPDEAARRRRARELAVERAPGLIEEYEEIGGSPLNAQAVDQARAVEALLRQRGVEATAYPGFQFLEPTVDDAVRRAAADGADRLVALPVYPLCGHSTTVAALASARKAAEAVGFGGAVLEVAGWHGHPDYAPLHADHAARFAQSEGIAPADPDTALLFSIHGTPMKYLEEGNRYDRYVEEACRSIAEGLGVSRYWMGYQNHTNRPIEWTKPDVEAVIPEIARSAARVLVLAVSFMHEQSETLAELDRELRGEAEAAGLAFHRVPVPHDDPRFVAVLADVVQARLALEDGTDGTDGAGGPVALRRCICRSGGTARCTNGLRLAALVER